MRTAPAQHLRDQDYADMRRQIKQTFYTLLYKPVLEELHTHTAQRSALLNAPNALRDALRAGRVQYHDGVISGTFNAAISKGIREIGGVFSVKRGVYLLPSPPSWVLAEAAGYQERARAAHDAIVRRLDQINQNLDDHVQTVNLDAAPTVGKIESGFKETARILEVRPELNEESRRALATGYSDNMKLWIKKWTGSEIRELRDVVDRSAMQGFRFDRLIDAIEARYDVSESKATFLARQETGLFMSAYRALRVGEAGVKKYRWSNSHDARVRPAPGLTPAERRHAGNHRKLDGMIFSYATKAPAIYMSSGSPCNPGEDFNCRCVDIPILEAMA